MSNNQMMSEEEMAEKNQIVNQYKMMRQQVQALAGKISELDAERNEHEYVSAAVGFGDGSGAHGIDVVILWRCGDVGVLLLAVVSGSVNPALVSPSL